MNKQETVGSGVNLIDGGDSADIYSYSWNNVQEAADLQDVCFSISSTII